jgi:small conductance mechanosensitive channel
MNFIRIASLLTCLVVANVSAFGQEEAAPEAEGSEAAAPEPVTTGDPTIATDQLDFLVTPLTLADLEVEAEAWQELLKAKAAEVAEVEIALAELSEEEAEAAEGEDPSAADGGDEAAEEEVSEEKQALLDQAAGLRDERTALMDRFTVVIDEMESKGAAVETVEQYRQYVSAVSGIKVDVSDTEAAWGTIMGWVQSEEGGQRWARNMAIFVGIILASWLIAKVVGFLLGRALRATEATSTLLRRFLVKWVSRVIVAIGVVMALAALEVNIGPLLAAIGAAGFVIAFALQSTLSNIASGLMILTQRPFDVGDSIDVAGISGKVDSVDLFSTHVSTSDNKKLVVPNNSIWGNVITNATISEIRRLEFDFELSASEDPEEAQRVIEDIINGDERVLENPEPVIHIGRLSDASIGFVCWPWVKTEDYDAVRWDVIKQVRQRFDVEAIKKAA